MKSIEAEHTPGPWTLDFGLLANGHIAVVADRYGIGKVWNTKPGTRPTNEANARLIAAAPEMLDLLKRAGEANSQNDDVRTAWWEARAATLSKAGSRHD